MRPLNNEHGTGTLHSVAHASSSKLLASSPLAVAPGSAGVVGRAAGLARAAAGHAGAGRAADGVALCADAAVATWLSGRAAATAAGTTAHPTISAYTSVRDARIGIERIRHAAGVVRAFLTVAAGLVAQAAMDAADARKAQ